MRIIMKKMKEIFLHGERRIMIVMVRKKSGRKVIISSFQISHPLHLPPSLPLLPHSHPSLTIIPLPNLNPPPLPNLSPLPLPNFSQLPLPNLIPLCTIFPLFLHNQTLLTNLNLPLLVLHPLLSPLQYFFLPFPLAPSPLHSKYLSQPLMLYHFLFFLPPHPFLYISLHIHLPAVPISIFLFLANLSFQLHPQYCLLFPLAPK